MSEAMREKKRDLPWWVALIIIVFFPLIVFVAIIAFVLYFITSICLHILIWTLWYLRGRDILFVYSDSPTWHDYVEQRLLPPIRHRAIILNWSQRKRWRFSLALAAFRLFGGYREFIRSRLSSGRCGRQESSASGNRSATSSTVGKPHFTRWRKSSSH
jgi:hypothetical protein